MEPGGGVEGRAAAATHRAVAAQGSGWQQWLPHASFPLPPPCIQLAGQKFQLLDFLVTKMPDNKDFTVH